MNKIEFYDKFNEFASVIQRLALKFTNRNMNKARQLYLETSHMAFKQSASLKHTTHFGQWITKLMSDVMINELRTSRENASDLEKESPTYIKSDYLIQLIEQLDPDEQDCFLRYFQGYSVSEIAVMVQRSEAEIQHSIKSAKRHLKALVCSGIASAN